jgi:NAD(P)H dehydrogenase (quinone)
MPNHPSREYQSGFVRRLMRVIGSIVLTGGLSVAILGLGGPAAAHAQGAADDRIIVSGASGNLGGLAVQALLDSGVPASRLILVSRTPEALSGFAALGAATRFGDFTEPESLPAAYAGGKRMLLISIGGGASLPAPRPELHKRAIDAAIAAGVEHIAYTSWIGITSGETDGLSSDHLATENMLKDSGVAWTMLRNSIYMDGVPAQAAAMIESGRAVVPPNESKIAYVTRADCAAAAAAVVSTPGHENRAYDITGPELIGVAEIAAAASAVSGEPIEIIAGGAGAEPGFGSPATSIVSTDVELLTGAPPTSLRELLEQSAAR